MLKVTLINSLSTQYSIKCNTLDFCFRIKLFKKIKTEKFGLILIYCFCAFDNAFSTIPYLYLHKIIIRN